ncbi:hypothetical protein CIHG_03303 [Coccidioides immitis H538.4]|uniref:Uncharacterized protein n=1 Tax=Coccidioides immitis H538.4 TaxID=396776 RepID=A0A0J8RK30_COCIT|nr:hypothetical protein CIHG_03303 [Coccidioides immitis H538.4]
MPRPPAKRGRAPRQNASSAASRPAARNANEHTVKAVKGRKWQDKEEEVSRASKVPQETPARPNQPVLERRSSTRGRRRAQTPVIGQRQIVHPGSATSVFAAEGGRGHGARGRFSVGPKQGDANSFMQKIGMGTPAFESSMLSAFRPRPRQKSILQLMADDESSDLGDEENFLGSLEPEDESTPLNLGKRKTLTREELASSDGCCDIQDDIDEERIPESPLRRLSSFRTAFSSPTNLKKRKIMVVVPVLAPEELSQYEYHRDTEEPVPDIENIDDVEIVEETQHSPSEDDDDLLPPMRQAPPEQSPEAWSQTLAPPMSSSPARSPIKSPARRKSSTKAPKKKIKTDSEAQPHISTATLQASLMPQRRRRRRRLAGNSEFDVFDDDDGTLERSSSPELRPDEDELSYLPVQSRRRGTSKKLKENRAALNRLPRRGESSGSKEKRRKPVEARLSRPSRGKERATYSRRRAGDEENSTISLEDTRDLKDGGNFVSEELLKQAAKFTEVDQWSIDFEDVEAESSPYR